MTDWREIVVSIFQVGLIVSSAAFGALALFTEYKKDGKVTKYGRLAAVGIVLSAIFSLGIRWAQDSLDHEASENARLAAEAERKKMQQRFDRQQQSLTNLLAGLQKVASDLEEVQTQSYALTNSMEKSVYLQDQAKNRLLLAANNIDDLSRQENQNTGKVIKSLWYEVNRVNLESARVRLRVLCSLNGTHSVPNFISADSFQANLRVVSSEAKEHGIDGNKRFPLISVRDNRFKYLNVKSNKFDFSKVDNINRNMLHINRTYDFYFSGLSSLENEYWANPDNWQNSISQITILSINKPILKLIKPRYQHEKQSRNLRNWTIKLPNIDGFPKNINYLPCFGSMQLNINGRFIFSKQIRFMESISKNKDRATIYAYSGGVEFPKNALPKFTGN